MLSGFSSAFLIGSAVEYKGANLHMLHVCVNKLVFHRQLSVCKISKLATSKTTNTFENKIFLLLMFTDICNFSRVNSKFNSLKEFGKKKKNEEKSIQKRKRPRCINTRT